MGRSWLVLLQKRQNNKNPFFFFCSVKVKTESQDPSSSWRSLIPVIKVNVSTVSENTLIMRIFSSVRLKIRLAIHFSYTFFLSFCSPSCFRKVLK